MMPSKAQRAGVAPEEGRKKEVRIRGLQIRYDDRCWLCDYWWGSPRNRGLCNPCAGKNPELAGRKGGAR